LSVTAPMNIAPSTASWTLGANGLHAQLIVEVALR